MKSTDENARETPIIDLLSLLHQYESLHSHATSNLKGSYWNITKARRERGFQAGGGGFGGVEYSVENVREELRAQAVLEWKESDAEEPSLINEDSSECSDKDHCGSEGIFALHFDGMKTARWDMGKQETEKKEMDGLRRRGNATSQSSKPESDKWTEESHENDEEELLLSSDPLTLFGVPPPALRIAQARSRDAVAYYVEVANVAMQIMRITNACT
ncbi:hypothetical protein HJC23_000139 [Cyclotella cryptica]|uniref:Vacuolar ATPase assembly protein VMA22 n=1 Tax=Cyclotella cryptica TaxID=29204 RepID=A0ABD3PJG4_9STRA|eukprot:CCRYP_014086-RA/>CCRYP_014086-RA protein AED:0.13 eAED:0.13 QI:0/-1/0/1/-1/1/1/0/215